MHKTLALGNVAYRVGKKLEWDPVHLKATNASEPARSFNNEKLEVSLRFTTGYCLTGPPARQKTAIP